MKTMLFEPGRYFANCHASTVLALADGTVLCAYFAGTREKDPDVGIWLSRRTEGKWAQPVCIAKSEQTAHWNPVLFEDGDGVRICYKVGREIPIWRTRTRVSRDGGKTWSPETAYPEPLADCGPVRSKPLKLSDGSLIAPNSTETPQDWAPRLDISHDGGASWEKLCDLPINKTQRDKPGYFAGKGAIQPALWQSASGLHAFLRTTEGEIYRTDSADGKTWCMAYPTGLPNNNSGIETVQDDQTLFLVCNPVGANWGARFPLVILRSDDDGKTFRTVKTLEPERDEAYIEAVLAQGAREGYHVKVEYSYPAAMVRGGRMYVTYTYHRRSIAFWEIPLEELK